MPGVGFGVYTGYEGVLHAGEEVSSTYEGRHITVEESRLIHPFHADGFVDKGDPVIVCATAATSPHATYGRAVGVALNSASAITDLIAIDTEGIWQMVAYADDDAGTQAIAPGDALWISDDSTTTDASIASNGTGDAAISKIRSNVTQVPFGYALGTMGAGFTGTIAVKVHWDPRSHWLLDDEMLYFGDARNVSIEWSPTERSLQTISTIVAPDLADGRGQFATIGTVTGTATASYSITATWMNIGDAAQMTVGTYALHNDGIWEAAGATLTGGIVCFQKYHGLFVSSDMAIYTIWNLNLLQAVDALMEVNNPAMIGFVAGVHASAVVGSVPLYTTGGGATKWVRVYADAT